jgi:hypothetical protein
MRLLALLIVAMPPVAAFSLNAAIPESPAGKAALPPIGRCSDVAIGATAPAMGRIRSRILFDVAHHNIHKPDGRYRPFADLIAANGFKITANQVPFSHEGLQDYDILLISNALGDELDGAHEDAPAFQPAEIGAVKDWVEGGGSLLLVADHPPASRPASALARAFGVVMSNAYAIDPLNYDRPSKELGQLVFTRQSELLGDHPITRGRNRSEYISRVISFTGQSLSLPEGARPLLILSPTAINVLFKAEDYRPAQGYVQGLAMRCGRGRVVILGEAAMLTDQGSAEQPNGISYPGFDNRQFALNVMRWLSGEIEP